MKKFFLVIFVLYICFVSLYLFYIYFICFGAIIIGNFFFIAGAFLIPYAIMMLIEGIPLFFLEFAIGQRFRRSALGCYNRIHPALKGLGIGCIVVSLTGCIYYIVVIAWSFFYLFASFTSKLPWSPDRCSGLVLFLMFNDFFQFVYLSI